jgi:septal ring factor EnvC (AmiA/AmiB activator)
MSSSADEAERLAELRREIGEREERARVFADEAEGYLGELEAIDRELAEVRSSARRLRKQLGSAERELRGSREGLALAERVLDSTRLDLEARLVALYKLGATAGLSTLYSSRDFQGFLRRHDALGRILAEDSRVFERHRLAQVSWTTQRAAHERVVGELETSRRELSAREDRIREKGVERRNLIALLRNRSEGERRAAGELRDAATRLERALAELSRGAQPVPGPGLERGALPMPVDGTLRSAFGREVDPEFGTEVVRNGIELAAPIGEPVRAVAGGRVLFAGWFRGYGQIVILDHGDRSVTVSGYLEEVGVSAGQSVGQGERIGSVGETGSLAGPGLYFEVRYEGRPVDPEAWLLRTP